MSANQLVFFGTGPVSLGTLEGIADHFTIEAIITKPDGVHPSGKTYEPAVKAWAEAHGIPLFQPATKTELSQLFANHPFHSKLGLVVDYGLIIPEDVINSFPLGIINSHFSLLPQWRGADPITAAILSGQHETGVSLMLIVPPLDEGDLIAQAEFEIPPAMTTPELTDALVQLSNKVIQSNLPHYINGSLKPYSQDTKITPTYTKKLKKSDGIVDWSQPATIIERMVRAYQPWPGTKATVWDREVTIMKSHISNDPATQSPGEPFKTSAGELAVATGQGTLIIDELKPAGKNKMSGQAFLSGQRI